MKKVIIQPEDENSVLYNRLQDGEFIGVVYNEDQRAYIAKWGEKMYFLANLCDIDLSQESTYDTIQAVLEERWIVEAFVFKTQRELIDWLNGKN